MGGHLNDGWWDDMEAPQKMETLMGEVCVAMGCVLRYEPKSEAERKAEAESEGGRVPNARMVALEWASGFSVWSESLSAHEVVEVGVKLREMLEAK